MKYFFILIIPFLSFGQIHNNENDSEIIEAVETNYTDYENGYSIETPQWLKLNHNLSLDKYGGTMPEVKGIENAIMINALKKNRFENFEDFIRIFITGNKFGQPMLFNENFTFYGRNEYDFKKVENGVSSRIFYIYKNKVYHNQFVLLETSSSYLFIHFCSTPETYDINIKKFDEFLKALKLE